MSCARKILVGIHVRSHLESLNATLLSLWGNTTHPFELVLLADGPDARTVSFLDSCARIRKSTTAEIEGAPACFNRLVNEAAADIYIFLENGVTFSDGWLEHLLQALDADASHGLAGPSTNRSWNEQQVNLDTVEADGFCGAWQELTPLYSLSDFCLVVKKEVVEKIGGADENYGRGPCWEMDYNVRAARAGFKGVWAKGALVYRSAHPANRIADESRLFEASKRRYQDKFCALRRDTELAYCSHCAGDACEYFAKSGEIRITLPASYATVQETARDFPLVSCIMPTCNRASFVAQSIRYFLNQDYPNRELIIIYEKENDLPGTMDEPRIRLVKSPPGSSIGAKRNQGVVASMGSLIAQWDDDDWYSPRRLSAQIEPILSNIADITALSDNLFFDLHQWKFWCCSRSLFGRMFVENVAGGTLVYRKEIWGKLSRYPDISLREDADFMRKAMRKGSRLCRIPGRELYIYLRHGMNSWKFQEGRYLDPNEWNRVSEPFFFGQDRHFYHAISQKSVRIAAQDKPLPLVSCIMPTAGRKKFVPDAIRHFQKQDYPNRELIVVDDGEESVADLIPAADNIRYLRLDQKHSLGTKRNLACEMSGGEIIVHWDDDDWMAPQWVRTQVDAIISKEADVCGLDRIFFYAPEQKKAWRYVYDGNKPWIYGGTLVYTKSFWHRNPFLDMNIGEDNAFVWGKEPKTLVTHEGYTLYIATVHSGNTSPKHVTDRRWHEYPIVEIERILNC